jgi:uncharacterized protein YneF (UPF0154 family)
MDHLLIANVSKVLLVLGTVFLVTKQVNKRSGDNPRSLHNRFKVLLYQLHVNGKKIGILLGFVHGFTIEPRNVTYVWTGRLLGLCMLVLLGTGAYLSIKQQSSIMTPEDDETWRTIRLLKWMFTPLLFIEIGLHYLL